MIFVNNEHILKVESLNEVTAHGNVISLNFEYALKAEFLFFDIEEKITICVNDEPFAEIRISQQRY